MPWNKSLDAVKDEIRNRQEGQRQRRTRERIDKAYDEARQIAKRAGDQYMKDHPSEPKSDPNNVWTINAVHASHKAFRLACKNLRIDSCGALPE